MGQSLFFPRKSLTVTIKLYQGLSELSTAACHESKTIKMEKKKLSLH